MIRYTLLAACFAAAPLIAQTTGSVEGVVRDPSGAVVPGARVIVVEAATAAERLAEADSAGRFHVPQLAPGTYQITASRAGFRDQAQAGIQIAAGASTRADFSLALEDYHDQVAVTAEAVLIDASPSGAAGFVRQQQLENLPVAGRDVFELAAQQPGVQLVRNADQSVTRGQGAKFSVHGVRPLQNGFLLDGIPMSDSAGSVGASAAEVTLGVESMREVVIVTSPFSAEYGRSAGAVFAAVTKSGGNQAHGSAYEYFRNDALDARNFFADPSEAAQPLRRNQFGGLLSGPLRRNRAFFLFNYEAIREARSSTLRPVVPNAAARLGLLPAAGGTKAVAVAESVKPYLALYPLPNGRDFGDGTAEYVHRSTRRTREDYLSGKIDVLPSPSLRLSGRYAFDDAVQRQPQALAIWDFHTVTRNQFASAEMQSVLSPRTVHVLRAAFSRVPAAELASLMVPVPASLSFVPGQPLGVIAVTGLADIGPSVVRQRPRRHVLNTYQAHDDLVHVRGRGAVKIGAGLYRVQFNQVADFSACGYYQFNSLQEFLAGTARTADVMVPGSDSRRGWRQTQGFAYVQHELRWRPGLSVSYGMRLESAGTPAEVNGKVAALVNYLADSAVTLGAGPYRNPSGFTLAPRASLAWDLHGDGRTLFRAGAGVFNDLVGVRDLIVAGGRMPPFYSRVSVTRPSFPNLATAIQGAAPLTALDTIDYNLLQPYVAQVQVSVERQLDSATVVSATYAFTRGVHLMSFVGNVNATPPQYLPDGRIFLADGAGRLNPAFSQIAMRRSQFDSVYHGLTLSLRRNFRHGVGFQAGYQWAKSIDNSSSTISNDYSGTDSVPTVYDYRANRGLSDFDQRGVFSGSLSWALPALHGGGWARLARGWELHALVAAQTGLPFAPTVGFDRVRLLTTRVDLGQRPDYAGFGRNAILGGPDRYFDPTLFALPAAGFFGTLGRNTLAGPGLFTMDAALHRTLVETGRGSLGLRVQAFNLANRANFRQPSGLALFDSSGARLGSAGRITETSTPARQIQVALRWTF